MLSILSAATLSIFLAERRLINVISFLIFVFGGNILSSSKGDDKVNTCTEYKRFEISIMDCTGIEPLKGLPDHLSANIQGLNVSGVRLSLEMKNDTYAKFKDSLLLLDTSNIFSYTISATGIYLILSKLIYLDISYDCLSHKVINERLQLFPINLKVLKLNGCSIELYDISYLISLEELYLNAANVKKLPRISAQAPLRFLDLAHNDDLSELSPMDLAHFCTLREVVLDTEPNLGLNKPEYYCLCISLKNWFTKMIIKTSIACTQPYPAPDCHLADLVEANASAIHTRRCPRRARRRWWLSLPLIILLFLTIIACVMVMIRRSADKAQSAHDDQTYKYRTMPRHA